MKKAKIQRAERGTQMKKASKARSRKRPRENRKTPTRSKTIVRARTEREK